MRKIEKGNLFAILESRILKTKTMIEKLQHLIDLTSTGNNTYLYNKLVEIKTDYLNELQTKLKTK